MSFVQKINRTLLLFFISSLVVLAGGASAQQTKHADSLNGLLYQWQQGLSGSKLTAYQGSVVSSNSTLTVIDFCRNGRYRYYREGSWTVPGMVGGASNNTITGNWSLQQRSGYILLVYSADAGQHGMSPVYLQKNGRVNIGGTAYAVQRGGAGC